MQASTLAKSALALLLLGLASYGLWHVARDSSGVSDKAFFYDLSEGKLFTAPRSAVPPIRGLNDATADAVRAVVISTNGHPEDKSSRTVAYLEMYSPELKRQMEQAQATGGSPAMGRAEAQAHRFVRRLADPQWFPLGSPEGELIVSDWARPGPNGITPVVCAP